MKDTRRGWHEEDIQRFTGDAHHILSLCAKDITYLLDRGYPYKSAVTFVGNHYLLTERQRNALMRICSSAEMKNTILSRQLPVLEKGCAVNIDAFNAVILMETALSGSMILKGADGCYRDLSGLAGTYAVIQNTDPAIERIIRKLQEHEASLAVFWIDSPVSNSGRLKTHIAEVAEQLSFPIDIRMVHNADTELKKLDHVISGDSAVLAECINWYNLYRELMDDLKDPWILDITGEDHNL